MIFVSGIDDLHGFAVQSSKHRHGQEAMEGLEGNLLHDKEGTGLEEEANHGHELDDEEREALEEERHQPHLPSPPPHGVGAAVRHTGIRILMQ